MAGFPAARYAKGKAPVVVADPGAEKALGKGWYEHPADAEAGRKLTPVERGGGPQGPSQEEVANAAKAKSDAEARDRAASKTGFERNQDRLEADEEARSNELGPNPTGPKFVPKS
jgi:hypothetical protein